MLARIALAIERSGQIPQINHDYAVKRSIDSSSKTQEHMVYLQTEVTMPDILRCGFLEQGERASEGPERILAAALFFFLVGEVVQVLGSRWSARANSL